ncbi:MAG: Hsp20/alpha crystallin family protein [Deltaproteobacteria bacterium]|nr:Hsp20/alpha crystallin family protein [Deltaproteobacteria bacterium]
MEYIKIRFGKNLGQMHSRIQKTIDDMFQRVNPLLAVLPGEAWRPQMDIFETDDAIMIVCEVSGVKKENLVVEIDSGAVKISGKREEPHRSAVLKYHLAEIPYGSFERILMLPVPIDVNEVTASYNDGILNIKMTKRVPDKVHQIPIEEV